MALADRLPVVALAQLGLRGIEELAVGELDHAWRQYRIDQMTYLTLNFHYRIETNWILDGNEFSRSLIAVIEWRSGRGFKVGFERRALKDA